MDATDDKQFFRKSLTIVPTPSVNERTDSFSEPEARSPLPAEESLKFDQSIAVHQYVGSFTLKFFTSESTKSGKGVTDSEAQPESNKTAPVLEEETPQELTCSSEAEVQKISLKFFADGKPSYKIQYV